VTKAEKEKDEIRPEFSRKRGQKETLVNFGVIEYLEFVLLRELELLEGKGESCDGISQENLLSILFVMAGPLLEEGKDAHLFCESQDKPTAMEIFVKTVRTHIDITMALMQALHKELRRRDIPQFNLLQENLAETSDIQIADHFVNDRDYSIEETPTVEKIQTDRMRFGKYRKEWLRLRKKYCERFCLPPPEGG
jgi:hypothetical protein